VSSSMGTPVIVPVLAVSDSPKGKFPETIAHA
jgi:hypothetical protein